MIRMREDGWPKDPRIRAALADFGRALRAARHRMGISQSRLEARSGVDQSAISRLERAQAVGCPVTRIVMLGEALGRNLPLGWCPHEHACAWQPPPEEPGRRQASGGWEDDLLALARPPRWNVPVRRLLDGAADVTTKLEEGPGSATMLLCIDALGEDGDDPDRGRSPPWWPNGPWLWRSRGHEGP